MSDSTPDNPVVAVADAPDRTPSESGQGSPLDGLPQAFESGFGRLRDLEGEFRRWVELLEQRATEVAAREAAVAQEEARWASKEQEIADREAFVAQRTSENDARDGALVEREKSLNDTRAAVQADQSALEAQQQELAEARKALEEERGKLDGERLTLEQTRQELDQRKAQLDADQQKILDEEKALTEREAAIEKFQHAFSQMAAAFGKSGGESMAWAMQMAEAGVPMPGEQMSSVATAEPQAAPIEQGDPQASPSAPVPDTPDASPQAERPSSGKDASVAVDLGPDSEVSDSVDTVDLSDEEVEKFKVLRRLHGGRLTDAQLLDKIRAERTEERDTDARRGKRGWFK